VWGCFDITRVNYAGGVLDTGTSHVNLRAIITANGGSVAAATPTLTPAYLAGVNVFYTSLLRNSAVSTLSAAEQSALQAWIAAGGTLIVTGDIYALPGYDSFTAFYGVTGWTSISTCGTGGSPADVLAAHAVTVGVTDLRYCTQSTFTYGADALLLADDGPNNRPFMTVQEPATGFTAGGRILVLGDHNLFSDSYINNGSNRTLATNMVRWACGCPSAVWSNYGRGWPGTSGIPALTSSGNPVLGSSITLSLGNSLGATTAGALVVGTVRASLPTPFGGTLLVTPVTIVPVTVPAGGLALPIGVPNVMSMCGTSVLFQGAEGDPGASHGVSFSAGLDLLVGQ
jgi:hypothetical protein